MRGKELKTLKGIEDPRLSRKKNLRIKRIIKAEAIKLRKLDKEGFKEYLKVNHIDLNAMFILTLFIEHFFNITEEELEDD